MTREDASKTSMMVVVIFLTLVISLVAYFVWWGSRPAVITQTTINNVVRVLLVNENHYIVFERKGDNLIPHNLYASCNQHEQMSVVLCDVPEGKPMYANYYIRRQNIGAPYHRFEIHIHAPQNIEGGGWEKRVGKTTIKGMNHVIE